jgi:hypothetical protein
MIKPILLSLLFFICLIPNAYAQAGDTLRPQGKFTFSGFVDAYYVYDFNRPADNQRPDFLYNHTRHNEFNINLALLQGHYTSDRVRATVGLMAGTYSQYNLAHEQEQLRHIWEAYAGVRVAKDLWLDAGVFLSHIGFENAISTENYTLTRSIVAENTPYYLSGAKLTYTPERAPWEFTFVIANGWQNIRETEGNTNKAIGTQITYVPHERFTFNYSTLFSNEYPDIMPRWRYFHNLYAIWQATDKLGLIGGFDTGLERERLPGSVRSVAWWNPTAIIRYQPINQFAIAGRVEYYSDPSGIMIAPQDFRMPPAATINPNGFNTAGYSLNLDYIPVPGAMLRIEGRMFRSQDPIFMRQNAFVRHNAFIATSMAVNF